MYRIRWILLFVFSMISLIGCQSFQTFSPEQIIEKALIATEEPRITYYGEMTLTGSRIDDGEIFENATIKEWHDGNRIRNEISSSDGELIVVTNDSKMQTYDVNEALVYEANIEALAELTFSPKEQLNELLSLLKDTHKVETVGTETIANRPTIHLKATVNEETKSIVGDLHLWIDEEHWIPLKIEQSSGQMLVEMEYTTINFGETFDDSIFELQLPDGVTVETIDDFVESELVKLEDLPIIFEQAVYVLDEKDSLEIDVINFSDGHADAQFKLVEIDYKYNGLPTMSLVISHHDALDEENELLSQDLFDNVIEKISIRNTEGYLLDFPELRMLSWEENGLEYVIQVIDPKIEVEELLQLVKSMIEIK